MDNNTIKKDNLSYNLEIFSQFIKHLYLPIENTNHDIKIYFENYINQIKNSINQVTGTATIKFPTNMILDEKEALKNKDLVLEYEEYLVKWSEIIKKTINEEEKIQPDPRSALSIIEYWRSRSAVLSTLYQELTKPEVGLIKNIIVTHYSNSNYINISNSSVNFDNLFYTLTKKNAEAKDNVKFLNTLERQFKNLQSDDLTIIEQTLPSLINGLKLVYIISRHFKSEEKISNLILTISNEICDKIELTLNLNKLLKPRDNISYEDQLSDSLNLIQQAKSILYTWKVLFTQKSNAKDDKGDQVEFNQRNDIIEAHKYLNEVIEDIKNIIEELKKFFVLLGPKLKSVTGNTDNIDELIRDIKKIVSIFEKISFNYFNIQFKNNWNAIYSRYKSSAQDIQQKTIKLIQSTFSDLRSSESAFELLQKFKSLESMEIIYKQLQEKYSDVLKTYEKEIIKNEEIFENNKNNVAILSKNKPPYSGFIEWKRSIFHRLKTPMLKFITNTNDWNPTQFELIKQNYIKFMRILKDFEEKKEQEWMNKIESTAMLFLKKKILAIDNNSDNRFIVNFPNEFKTLIYEAKNFDQLSANPIPKTILNISLQEKEYYRYINNLQKMLKEYDDATFNLSSVERDLLKINLDKLKNTLMSGVESYNLNSLGISDFIENCLIEIKKFNEIKNKVNEKVRMIEDILDTIENFNIIKENSPERATNKHSLNEEFLTLNKFNKIYEGHIEESASRRCRTRTCTTR